MDFAIGSIVQGTVTGITKFGAFVELPGGVTGLIHISEVADAYVNDVKDYLNEADQVQVKVVSIDEKGKIALSIKQAMPRKAAPPRGSRIEVSFEDKLAKFMKDSNEKLTAQKRHQDGRKGAK